MRNAILVGLGTYIGSVIAAKEWGEKMERMNVLPVIEGSWDNLIHKITNGSNSILTLRGRQRSKKQG
jgi:erythromycin esterase-like protein